MEPIRVRNHTGRWVSPLVLALLTACPYIGDDAAFDRFDVDDDGHAWPDDCDEADPDVHPGAPERCDGIDNNCDGLTDGEDAIDPSTWYNDLDGDGFGDADDTRLACALPEGWSATGDDCDDEEPDAFPGNAEVCNDGVDNDCDDDPMQCALLGEQVPPIDRSFQLPVSVAPMSPLGIAGGDFNGDGLADIAVGDPTNSQVFLFLAPFPAAPSQPDRVIHGVQGSRFGFALRAGDLDGDGVDELVVGAPTRSVLTLGGEITNAGVVYVLQGEAWRSEEAFDVTASALVHGTQAQEQLGRTLAIAYGAPSRVVIGSHRGIFFEDLAGLARGFISYHPDLGCPMSDALAALDVDGDGVDEILGASLGCATLVGSPGLVHLYPGDLIGQHGAEQARTMIAGPSSNSNFGLAMADHTDLDGDGQDDLVIGAAHALFEEQRLGAVYIFRTPPTGAITVDTSVEQVVGPQNSALFGFSLAGADLNGDGAAELLVGAPGGSGDTNRISGWYGPNPLSERPADLHLYTNEGTQSAVLLTRLGDVNGDGHDDLASLDPPQLGQAGSVRVILGSGQ